MRFELVTQCNRKAYSKLRHIYGEQIKEILENYK